MGIDPFARGGLQDAEAVLKAEGVDAFFRAVGGWTRGGRALVGGREVLMAGSNDYLGLSRHPRVVAAAVEALRRYGASVSGSRPLNGTIELHEELEARLAAHLGQQAAVVTTTGYQANLALAAALGPGDVAFADSRNHVSLGEGLRLGEGVVAAYRHRNLDDLRRRLAAAPPGGRLIVTDGVFSMEGDVAPIAGLRALADEFGAKLVVDAAHDLGTTGVPRSPDLITATFSKALGSTGGVIAGPAANVTRLRYNARSLVFSAGLAPASAAAALAALDVLETTPSLREKLFALARGLHDGLRALGFDTRPSTTPIVPVRFPDLLTAGRFWAGLCAAGVLTNLVGPPAAPRPMLRLTLTAAHDPTDVDITVRAFATVADRLGRPGAP